MSTTIEISKNSHLVWRRWCNVKKMNSVELMDRLIQEVVLKHQQKFYNSLPDPRMISSKPLQNIRLQKNYRKCNGVH
jgi:hypothetical protein